MVRSCWVISLLLKPQENSRDLDRHAIGKHVEKSQGHTNLSGSNSISLEIVSEICATISISITLRVRTLSWSKCETSDCWGQSRCVMENAETWSIRVQN